MTAVRCYVFEVPSLRKLHPESSDWNLPQFVSALLSELGVDSTAPDAPSGLGLVLRCALRRRLASIGQPLSLPEPPAIAHLTLVVRLPPPGWMLWIAPLRADKARSSVGALQGGIDGGPGTSGRAQRRSPALRLW